MPLPTNSKGLIVSSNKPVLSNKNRQDWNEYITWLRSKGLAGNPALDRNGYGIQVLQQYIKQNPKTSLTVDLVQPIQEDFSNYRNYALQQIKSGKSTFANGVNENNFMQSLSQLDNYAGSKTTSHIFPREYLTYIENSKPISTVDKGFVVMNK